MHLNLQLRQPPASAGTQQHLACCHRPPAAARSTPCTARQVCAHAVAEAEVVTEPLDSVDLPHADPPQGGLEIRVNKDVLEGGRVRLSITVPQSTVSHYWNVAVAEKQDAKKSSLPPKKQARKGRIIGKEEIKASLVERLGDLAMRQAWQAAGMADRLIEDSIAYDDVDSFDPDADFTFAVEADIVPEVRWTQPYRDLQVELVEPRAEDIPAMVETQLQAQLRQTGSLQVVQGRGFQQGDTAVVAFSAKNSSGQDYPGLNRPRMRIDSNEPEQLPGLIAGIAGMQPGQERDFTVPAPKRGADQGEVSCHVSMAELLVTEAAELNDEWVTSNFPSMSGVEDLRTNLLQGAEIAHLEQADQLNERAITFAIAGAVEVDVPHQLIVENARRRFEDQLAKLADKVPPEQMKQIVTEQAFTSYMQQRQGEIEESLRAVFGLADIAQREHITIEQTEVDQGVSRVAAEGMEITDEVTDNVAQTLLDKKVLQWLTENLSVTRVPMDSLEGME